MEEDKSVTALRNLSRSLVRQAEEPNPQQAELELNSMLTGHHHIKGRKRERERICQVFRQMAEEMGRCLNGISGQAALLDAAKFIEDRGHWTGRFDIGDDEKMPIKER